jgi:hypothetical protein
MISKSFISIAFLFNLFLSVEARQNYSISEPEEKPPIISEKIDKMNSQTSQRFLTGNPFIL